VRLIRANQDWLTRKSQVRSLVQTTKARETKFSLALPQLMNLYRAANDNSALIAHLDASLSHRLMLITGPSGSGKTALLQRWGESHQRRVAWVTLQLDDNVPERLWTDLTTALHAAGLNIQAESASELPNRMIDLINALADLPDDLVLILDNYHLISAPPIHAAVQLLLDYLPPQAHVVIASRVEPPLELARLRVRRQLVEITLRANVPSEEEHNE
jgi:LuxR family maltose regulon positive regulatory protein